MEYVRNQQDTADRITRMLPLVADRIERLQDGVGHSLGLTTVQLQLLEYIHRHGESSIGTLRRALRRAQSSISELTDRLEHKGFVARVATDDRRKSLVGLTSKGRAWMRNRDSQQRRALGQCLKGLDPESRQRLLTALMDVLSATDRLRERHPEFGFGLPTRAPNPEPRSPVLSGRLCP